MQTNEHRVLWVSHHWPPHLPQVNHYLCQHSSRFSPPALSRSALLFLIRFTPAPVWFGFLGPRCTLVLLNKSWPLEPRLRLGPASVAARNFAWRLQAPPKGAVQYSNVQSQIIHVRIKLNVHVAVNCCWSLVFVLNEGTTWPCCFLCVYFWTCEKSVHMITSETQSSRVCPKD